MNDSGTEIYEFPVDLQDLPLKPDILTGKIRVPLTSDEADMLVRVALEVRFFSRGRLFENDDEYYITQASQPLIDRIRLCLEEQAPEYGWELYMPMMDVANIALPDAIWSRAAATETWSQQLILEQKRCQDAMFAHHKLHDYLCHHPFLSRFSWQTQVAEEGLHGCSRTELDVQGHTLCITHMRQYYTHMAEAGIGIYAQDESSIRHLRLMVEECLTPFLSTLHPEIQETEENLIYIAYDPTLQLNDLDLLITILHHLTRLNETSSFNSENND